MLYRVAWPCRCLYADAYGSEVRKISNYTFLPVRVTKTDLLPFCCHAGQVVLHAHAVVPCLQPTARFISFIQIQPLTLSIVHILANFQGPEGTWDVLLLFSSTVQMCSSPVVRPPIIDRLD